MSDYQLKLCQGSRCHQYNTKDRLKGVKGSKTFQTRRRSRLLFDEFCDTRCYNDWFNEYGTRAIDHFGRTTEVKHLTEQNAWVKEYNYRSYRGEADTHYYINKITKEQRPLTEEQYRDTNYTLNER